MNGCGWAWWAWLLGLFGLSLTFTAGFVIGALVQRMDSPWEEDPR